jgi:hypothetical protein
MNLTQLQRIKTEQKHGFCEINKIGGPSCDYLWITGASREDLQDTLKSAREKDKGQG